MANRTNPTVGSVSTPGRSPESGGIEVRRGVKALVATPERALLVRERHADGTPFWTLPGGGAHPGEPLAAALRREMAEELRCPCTVRDTVGSFWYVHRSRRRTASVYTVLSCRLLDKPTPAPGEIDGIRWVAPGEVPARTLPGVETVIDRALR